MRKDPYKKAVVTYAIIVLLFLMLMFCVAIYYTHKADTTRNESIQINQ